MLISSHIQLNQLGQCPYPHCTQAGNWTCSICHQEFCSAHFDMDSNADRCVGCVGKREKELEPRVD